jgi:amino acid transporter
MIVGKTKRPRNVDAARAAAILYGDWGTSKAYVIGLAFAVAGYTLVGVNCMTICRHYPDGGGVYASVRHRSEIISIVGAFLLIAGYIVTAAISSLSAFQYLGVGHPEMFAGVAVLAIGGLNYFGPKHTGGLAFLVSVPLLPCYAVSDAAAETIVDIAATVGASQLILGAPQRNMVVNLLRGNIIRNISSLLPDEIDLLVYA